MTCMRDSFPFMAKSNCTGRCRSWVTGTWSLIERDFDVGVEGLVVGVFIFLFLFLFLCTLLFVGLNVSQMNSIH